MMMRPSQDNRRAITLLEMLAVIVLVALIAGTSVVGLGGIEHGASTQRAAAQLQGLDAQARLLAQVEKRMVVLSLNAQRDTASLQLFDTTGASTVVTSIMMPAGVSVRLDDGQVASIVFDRAGCSRDYSCHLQHDDARAAWHVAGLTGLITNARDGS